MDEKNLKRILSEQTRELKEDYRSFGNSLKKELKEDYQRQGGFLVEEFEMLEHRVLLIEKKIRV